MKLTARNITIFLLMVAVTAFGGEARTLRHADAQPPDYIPRLEADSDTLLGFTSIDSLQYFWTAPNPWDDRYYNIWITPLYQNFSFKEVHIPLFDITDEDNNSLIGELPGAHKKGYETTYWWEIINDRTLDKINDTCRKKTVYSPFPPVDFYFMHLLHSNKIHFKPSFQSWGSDYMLVYGRPYVEYWESHAKLEYLTYGNVPVPLWSIDIDGIPLLKVYKIVRLKNEKKDNDTSTLLQ